MATFLPSFSEYIKELNSSADVEIDLSKPLKLYFRSTELVFKQVIYYYLFNGHGPFVMFRQLFIMVKVTLKKATSCS